MAAKTPKLRAQLDNHDEASNESGLSWPPDAQGAKQSFKDEVDINTIVKRFGIGYEMPEGLTLDDFKDYTDVGDFKTNMDRVARIRENFELLPAHIRGRFDNNPASFHDFVINPENREEVKKMGLLSEEALQRDRDAQEQRDAEMRAQILSQAERTIPPSAGLGDEKPSPRATKNP